MATLGQYRIRGNPNYAQVDYGGKASMPIPEDSYRKSGYEPPFEALPWQEERGTSTTKSSTDA